MSSSRRARQFTDRMRHRSTRSSSSLGSSLSLSPRYSRSSERTDDEDDNYSTAAESIGIDDDDDTSHQPQSPSSSGSTHGSTTNGGSSEATSVVGHLSPRRNSATAAATTATSSPKEINCPTNVPDALAPPDLTPRRRSRVPGGAAAKLMLMGPRNDDDDDDDEAVSSPPLLRTPTDDSNGGHHEHEEIDAEMQKAKAEFALGTTGNRRYNSSNNNNSTSRPFVFMNRPAVPTTPLHTNSTSTISANNTTNTNNNTSTNANNQSDEVQSEVSSQAPSFLNRSEIFHDTAAAAVVALLKPKDENANILTGHEEVVQVYSGNMEATTAPSADTSAVVDEANYESPLKHNVSKHLITSTTERKLETLQSRMRNPNKTLTDLLTAIATQEDNQMCDLGFMVRRKNACGALQTLTTPVKNRFKICYTVGVLPALTSVLSDGNGGGDDVLMQTFPDARIRTEYKAARSRAVATLVNLVTPKENRIAVFHTPSLVQSAIQIVLEDNEEGIARRGCCTILAYLGKSPENRRLLAQIPGLLDALSKVLFPQTDENNTNNHHNEGSPSRKNEPRRYPSSKNRNNNNNNNNSGNPYDDNADDLLQESRRSVFALLHHLLKEKDNAYLFARDYPFIWTLVEISKYQASPSHVLAVKVLAQLTRHRLNTKTMVFQKRIVVPALVTATASKEARLYACYGLQNFAQDKSCRQELATTENLIVALCKVALEGTRSEEKLAAVSAIKNLCDEPANLIPMTNAPEGVSTLMHLARDGDTLMQYRACDALATLSHWLRKIATSGQSLDARNQGRPVPDGMCVPTLRVVSWNQWE